MTYWDNFNILKIEEAYKEAFAMHELLRRLGFQPKDIYISYDDGKVSTVLDDGENSLLLEVGTVNDSFEEFEEKWKELSFAIKNYIVSEKDLIDIWQNSLTYKHHLQILLILIKSGFNIKLEDNLKVFN